MIKSFLQKFIRIICTIISHHIFIPSRYGHHAKKYYRNYPVQIRTLEYRGRKKTLNSLSVIKPGLKIFLFHISQIVLEHRKGRKVPGHLFKGLQTFDTHTGIKWQKEKYKLKLQVQIYKLQLKVRGLHDPSL